MDEEIFSWLHLSDIHFGHGNRDYSANQRAVLRALRQHLQTTIRGQVELDAIFVTGDIAFSGKAEQYKEARRLLLDLADLLDVDSSRIFPVPGNHDIDRAVDDADPDIGFLLGALRSGSVKLSDALGQERIRKRLGPRMAAYLDFAASFAPVDELPGQPFSWKKDLAVDDVHIRLFGLNTALLCAGDNDRGKLQLGMTWIDELVGVLRPRTQYINIILTHHPFLGGWLMDGADADSWAHKYAQVHLMGHAHEADARATIAGNGPSLIRIVSGAGHVDPKDPPQHSYSYAKIVRRSDEGLWLHLFPYKWSNRQRGFVLAAERCDRGGSAAYPLTPRAYNSIPPAAKRRPNPTRRVSMVTWGSSGDTNPAVQTNPPPTPASVATGTPAPDETPSPTQPTLTRAVVRTYRPTDASTPSATTPGPTSTATSNPIGYRPDELTTPDPQLAVVLPAISRHRRDIAASPNDQAAINASNGMNLRHELDGGGARAVWPAWSPDGSRVACGHADGSLVLFDANKNRIIMAAQRHENALFDVAWSTDGRRIASASSDCVLLWNAEKYVVSARLTPEGAQGGYAVAWRPGTTMLAWRAMDDSIMLWRQDSYQPSEHIEARAADAIAWSNDGGHLAVAAVGIQGLEIRSAETLDVVRRLDGTLTATLDLAWMPGRNVLAAAFWNGSIALWDVGRETPLPFMTLHSHTDAVSSVCFSRDGRLFATKSHDGTTKIWRTDTWDAVATIQEDTSRAHYGGLAFSPVADSLATVSGRHTRIWDLDVDTLVNTSATTSRTVHSLSAKVVLLGEGSSGKSCLALRLVENRYDDLSSTHGMRFWSLPATQFDRGERAPGNEEREVVIWDLGGQSEYRLVHQLFLADTTVALLVIEPRRGQRALDEIEEWNKYLEKHHLAHPIHKILVAAKVDDESAPIDRAAINCLMRRLCIDEFVETSAKTPRGIDPLRQAVARGIRWLELGRTIQSELFHRIQRAIEAVAKTRAVVLPLSELEEKLRTEDADSDDPDAILAVVKQLARQGRLMDSRLADGTRALVLQVEQVDRYAGSLIVMARSHPRGIAAIELASIFSPTVKLPRIGASGRLRREQELVILDCVVQLLLENDLCIRHEGLLIFPSLFQPTEEDPGFPHAVALYYEFTGAVDNIYASLVTSLAVSRAFGPLRLWRDRAEYARPDQGSLGVRRSRRGDGPTHIARLDVYFDESSSDATRELFVSYVEEHLREHGVELLEQLTMTCACGCEIPEQAVRGRLTRGLADIICPDCETRLRLTYGAGDARERSPDIEHQIRALKTTTVNQRKRTIMQTKGTVTQIQVSQAAAAGAAEPPIRILHLSDLHVGEDADPVALLQPLAADLEDREDGLAIDRLDALVISGDISNRATAGELEKARELVSGLIARFGLTAERCILVPGNHDIDWNETVYRTVKKRAASAKDLVPGRYKEQGDLYEIRDDALYPNRFKSFSQYFYHPLLQQPYPLPPEQQCIPHLLPDLRLQFLALNSAWEIDEYFRDRSGILPGALARGITEADAQVRRARDEGRLPKDAGMMRIAVWHHPITGDEKIQDDAFVGSLQKAGVRVCLHGHVHEERADLMGYLHQTRSVQVAGAGSFGAPARERPESVPRMYNVIELARDHSRMRVHTRCLKKQTGAWEGWAVWPGGGRGERRTYYEVVF